MQEAAKKYIKENKKEFIKSYVGSIAPCSDRVAIFMAGCSGAGKTEYSTVRLQKDDNLLHIDTDRVRNLFVNFGYNGDNSDLFQPAAALGVEKLLDEALAKNLSMIFDTNFGNYEKQKRNIERCLEKGYRVEIVYILVELSKAYSNALAREVTTKRRVPEDKILSTLVDSIKTTKKIKAHFGSNVSLILIDRRNNIQQDYIGINHIDFEELTHTENKKAESEIVRLSAISDIQSSISILQSYSLQEAYGLVGEHRFAKEYTAGMKRIAEISLRGMDPYKQLINTTIIPLPTSNILEQSMSRLREYEKLIDDYRKMTAFSAIKDSMLNISAHFQEANLSRIIGQETINVGKYFTNSILDEVKNINSASTIWQEKINKFTHDMQNVLNPMHDMQRMMDSINPQKILEEFNPYGNLMKSVELPSLDMYKNEMDKKSAYQNFIEFKTKAMRSRKYKYYKLFSEMLNIDCPVEFNIAKHQEWVCSLKANIQIIRTFFDNNGEKLKTHFTNDEKQELIELCLQDKILIIKELSEEDCQNDR